MVTEEELILMDRESQKQNLINSQLNTAQIIESQGQQSLDVGMVKEQLDLGDVYDLIDHLLEGEVLIKDSNGNRRWTKPGDESMLLLSEEGINYVRRRMAWHINKNTLLSNYQEERILDMVKDFSISLQDALFMKSRQFFRQPSMKKCYEVFKKRLSRRAELKRFAYDTLGLSKSDEEINAELLKEVEGRIEKELETIRSQLIKNREKEFESLIIDIEYLLLSTYMRSLGGEERGSIRRHQQALEVKGGGMMDQSSNQAPKPGLISSLLRK